MNEKVVNIDFIFILPYPNLKILSIQEELSKGVSKLEKVQSFPYGSYNQQ